MTDYLIELSAVHLTLMAAYWFFLRKERQYAFRRYYIIGVAALSITVPFIKLPKLFVSENAVDVVPVKVAVLGTVPTSAINNSSSLAIEVVIWVYVAVSAFFLYKFVSSVWRLIYLRLKNSSEKIDGLYVYRIRESKVSFSFFDWIFLGENVDSDLEYRVMLEHEKAHAYLGHTFDIIFLELFKVSFWWLPTAWIANREMKKIHEYQADAYVLRSYGLDEYASILISSTLRLNGIALVSSFYDGFITKRLTAMKQQAKKVSPWKAGALCALCGVLFVALACTEEHRSAVAESATTNKDIFVVVERLPEPEGGMNDFYEKISSEIRYPSQALKNGVQGRVDVEFVVEKNGSLSGIKVINGIGAGCDEEGLKAIENAGRFRPGSQGGKPVRVRMVVPITFKIDESRSGNDKQGALSVLEMQPIKAKMKGDACYKNGEWSGVVYDEMGEGLPGVNILVEGTTTGTVSDLDGSFKLKASESNSIHLSFVGYESVQINSKELSR